MANNTRIVVTAEDKTKAALDSVVGNLGQLQGALGGLDSISGRLPAIGAGIAAAFGGISFAGIIKGSIDYADSLDELAQRTGVSVETLSSLRNAAELSGTSLEGVGKEVQKLSRNMAEAARGSSTQVQNFEALGVAVTDSQGNLRSSTDVLLELARAVGELEDPTERVIAAQLAFGKSGADLVPLLLELANNGLQVAEVTAEQASEAAMLNDQLDIMRQNARSAGESFSLTLMPAFAAVIDVAQGAGFAIKQLGSSLAVIAKDVQTAFAVIGTALTEGPSQSGRDKIRELLAERSRFIEAANEDLQDRVGRYESTLSKVMNPQASSAGASSGTSALSDRLKRLREEAERGNSGSTAAAKKQVDAMLRRQEEAARQVRDILEKMEFDPEQEKMLGDMNRQLEQTADRYKELADPAAKYREQLEEIQRLGEKGLLNVTEVEKSSAAIQKQIDGIGQSFEEWDEYAKSAARNVQTAFADFLFDPFEGGVEGMADNFARMIRRMAAEAAAANLSRALFGEAAQGGQGGGLLGDLFKNLGSGAFTGSETYQSFMPSTPDGSGVVDLGGSIEQYLAGFRADGGPVSAGKRYVVGERGPELFVPGASGMIVPNHAMAMPQVILNITNESGAQVSASPVRMTPQGPALDVLVRGVVEQEVGRFGSSLNRSVRNAQPALGAR